MCVCERETILFFFFLFTLLFLMLFYSFRSTCACILYNNLARYTVPVLPTHVDWSRTMKHLSIWTRRKAISFFYSLNYQSPNLFLSHLLISDIAHTAWSTDILYTYCICTILSTCSQVKLVLVYAHYSFVLLLLLFSSRQHKQQHLVYTSIYKKKKPQFNDHQNTKEEEKKRKHSRDSG